MGNQAMNLGLLRVVPNSVLEQREEDASRMQAEALQKRPEVAGLAAHVRLCWQAHKEAKRPIERRMLTCLRARKGDYSPSKLAKIREHGGSEIFMKLTGEKINAFVSWATDLVFPANDQPWGIRPSTVSSLPESVNVQIAQRVQTETLQHLQSEVQSYEQQTGQPVNHHEVEERLQEIGPDVKKRFQDLYDEVQREITEEAKKRANRAESVMKDIVESSGFEDEMLQAIDDMGTFPNCFLMGPVAEKARELEWGEDGQPRPVDKMKLVFKRLSPFDVFPAPSATSPENGDLIIRHYLTRKSLRGMIGVPHYSESAIKQVLGDTSGLSNWTDSEGKLERERLENKEQVLSDPSRPIEVLQFIGAIQGRMLIMNGVSPEKIPDPLAEYDAEVWLCGPYIIKAVLNGDLLGRKRVYTASFRDVPGSFWGEAIPEIISDIQDVCNNTARNLINNMGLGSGPQVGVDTSVIPPEEPVEKMYPWKIWQFDMTNQQNGTRPPIWFFQPNDMTASLLKIYEYFSAEADNKTGIPRYAYGTGKTQGAAKTSSGLSMLLSAAAKGIKLAVRHCDRGIIAPAIRCLYHWVMLYYPNPDLKGDLQVVARGSSALVTKEQQALRRNEAMQVLTNSQALLNLVGPEGLAEYARKFFQGLDVGADEVVPRKEEIAARNNKDQLIQQLAAQVEQYQQMLGAQEGQDLPNDMSAGQGSDRASMAGGMEASLFPGG